MPGNAGPAAVYCLLPTNRCRGCGGKVKAELQSFNISRVRILREKEEGKNIPSPRLTNPPRSTKNGIGLVMWHL